MKTAVTNRVEESRLKEGLSIVDLARLAEVSEATIKRVENGVINLRETTKYKIVQGFNQKPKRLRAYTYEYLFPNG